MSAGFEELGIPSYEDKWAVRKFESGATRDTDHDKYDYEAFFCPLVLERRAQFMHKNRFQKNGQVRDGDNWKKGIPLSAYMKSAFRHFRSWWAGYKGLPAEEDIEESICALMFNCEGYLHEILKNKKAASESAARDS